MKDFFSHKLHASGDEWPDKLVELACLFQEFDGKVYNRDNIEAKLTSVSPRASFVSKSFIARDISKYRDEISAYSSYLGLFYISLENGLSIFRLSDTAKKYLLIEEPRVSAFLILQLTLFQFPNASGGVYSKKSVRVQGNTVPGKLDYITNGYHLSPFRLICQALRADSLIHGITPHHPCVTVQEVYTLANLQAVYRAALPDLEAVKHCLIEIRKGSIQLVKKFENRVHILNHTDFLSAIDGSITIRETFSPVDAKRQIDLLEAICKVGVSFNLFDKCKTASDITSVIAEGAWNKYFDGASSLNGEIVEKLTFNPIESAQRSLISDSLPLTAKWSPLTYPLKAVTPDGNSFLDSLRGAYQQNADPEATRIKHQRANLTHKDLTYKMIAFLHSIGAEVSQNEHIDLYAKMTSGRDCIMEVKSVQDENLLSQVRKGLSQLYEYQFRYKDHLQANSTLCLIMPNEPKEISWMQEYLCNYRKIYVCWFDSDEIIFSERCRITADEFFSMS